MDLDVSWTVNINIIDTLLGFLLKGNLLDSSEELGSGRSLTWLVSEAALDYVFDLRIEISFELKILLFLDRLLLLEGFAIKRASFMEQLEKKYSKAPNIHLFGLFFPRENFRRDVLLCSAESVSSMVEPKLGREAKVAKFGLHVGVE